MPLLAPNPGNSICFPLSTHRSGRSKRRLRFHFGRQLTCDLRHWENLKDYGRQFITHVLVFFTTSNSIILETLLKIHEGGPSSGSACILLIPDSHPGRDVHHSLEKRSPTRRTDCFEQLRSFLVRPIRRSD